jgi:hypothetical protein
MSIEELADYLYHIILQFSFTLLSYIANIFSSSCCYCTNTISITTIVYYTLFHLQKSTDVQPIRGIAEHYIFTYNILA